MNAISRNSDRFVAAVEQDRDKLAFKFKLAVDKGNAAALVSFLVFDAIADTKIRKHEPDGLTMDADIGLIFLDNDQHFLDNRWGDLCFGIQ